MDLILKRNLCFDVNTTWMVTLYLEWPNNQLIDKQLASNPKWILILKNLLTSNPKWVLISSSWPLRLLVLALHRLSQSSPPSGVVDISHLARRGDCRLLGMETTAINIGSGKRKQSFKQCHQKIVLLDSNKITRRFRCFFDEEIWLWQLDFRVFWQLRTLSIYRLN